MTVTAPLRIAVVGAGWAGLAAAVEAVIHGDAVSIMDMAAASGGRARRADAHAPSGPLDNGQHILIGAYRETLRLMAQVGVDEGTAFLRQPLRLRDPDGRGLALPPGRAAIAFPSAVMAQRHWPLRARLALLAQAARWRVQGFSCPAEATVAQLTAHLPAAVRDEVIGPLCVAALNTPADAASGRVFLRVLRDALFAGPGASDLLLPRLDMGALFPEPAVRWLQARGAQVRLGRRVRQLDAAADGWLVDGECFDRVVLAVGASEAARLARPIAPGWAAAAGALAFEPIVTVYVQADGCRLPEAMLSLAADAQQHPAQFVFDLGALRGMPGTLAFVVSGAAHWVARGNKATGAAVLQQARALVAQVSPSSGAPAPVPALLRVITEKRATFRCVPQLQRPAMAIAPGLLAAGDYVDGPYPSTLEGAVRSGVAAARASAEAATRAASNAEVSPAAG